MPRSDPVLVWLQGPTTSPQEESQNSAGYRKPRPPPCRHPHFLPSLRGFQGESTSPFRRKRKCVSAGSWRLLRTCRTLSCWRSSLTSRFGTGSASPGAVPPRAREGPGGGGLHQEMDIWSPRGRDVLTAGPLPQGLSPLEEAGGRPVAVATCRPDALHGMRGWPGRSGPRSGWPDLEDHASNPVFRARLFRVHPGRVSYLLHCDVQASVSPPPEWVLPKSFRERAY